VTLVKMIKSLVYPRKKFLRFLNQSQTKNKSTKYKAKKIQLIINMSILFLARYAWNSMINKIENQWFWDADIRSVLLVSKKHIRIWVSIVQWIWYIMNTLLSTMFRVTGVSRIAWTFMKLDNLQNSVYAQLIIERWNSYVRVMTLNYSVLSAYHRIVVRVTL